MLASRRNGTLYIGVTNNRSRRIWDHKNGLIEGFTKKYQVHQLVYSECLPRASDAIAVEKRLKKWHRAWKFQLIECVNPEWKDLYEVS